MSSESPSFLQSWDFVKEMKPSKWSPSTRRLLDSEAPESGRDCSWPIIFIAKTLTLKCCLFLRSNDASGGLAFFLLHRWCCGLGFHQTPLPAGCSRQGHAGEASQARDAAALPGPMSPHRASCPVSVPARAGRVLPRLAALTQGRPEGRRSTLTLQLAAQPSGGQTACEFGISLELDKGHKRGFNITVLFAKPVNYIIFKTHASLEYE